MPPLFTTSNSKSMSKDYNNFQISENTSKSSTIREKTIMKIWRELCKNLNQNYKRLKEGFKKLIAKGIIFEFDGCIKN